ncbi:MAG: ABC transporter substrate-binding protein [Proteobacteria bacterium]|nr:MAG: ABC transporter substrate-binding protein [Pseudomonadota bacterium]
MTWKTTNKRRNMFNITRIKTLFACLLMAAILGSEAMAKTVIRYAEFGPNRGARAEALKWWADEIANRTSGEVEVEFHWGKALLGTKAVLQGVSDGVADAGSIIGFFTPKELRGYNIGDLPVENSDEWVGMRALYEYSNENPSMQKEWSDSGVVYMTNYTTGPIQLICKSPTSSVAELAGVKVRASGPYGKALESLGADVQRMGQGDVYQALDSGLIECNQNYYYSMKAYKQYEVASHVVELDWGQNMAFGIVMNAAAWNALPDSQKEAIRSVNSDFIDYMAKIMIEGLESDKAEMIAGIDGKAIDVSAFPQGDREKLLAAGRAQVDAWVAQATEEGHDGAAMLADYTAAIDKYTAELESKGYPWNR